MVAQLSHKKIAKCFSAESTQMKGTVELGSQKKHEMFWCWIDAWSDCGLAWPVETTRAVHAEDVDQVHVFHGSVVPVRC